MRLGVVTTSYPREAGDPAGSFVAGFARFVAGRGHEVEVVAAGPGATRLDGIAITRVDGGGLFYDEGAPDRLERDRAAWRRAPGFTLRLVAALRGRGFERVASHWLLPSGLAAATLRRPHLAVAHSADVHLAARPVVADAVAAALLAGPSRVAFVAEHLRERMLAACSLSKRLLSDRSLVCPMGIDPVEPPARPAAVTFLGRLVPIKGADLLVAAARELPVPVVIAGDGPLRAALRQAAPHNVTLPGELRGAARYAGASVVVVPSRDAPSGRTEGAPTVIIEAFAAGVPVVASDLPATRPLAAALRLVAPGDHRALAAAIRETLAGGPDVAARVARGRAIAAERAWPVVGQRLLDVWMAI